MVTRHKQLTKQEVINSISFIRGNHTPFRIAYQLPSMEIFKLSVLVGDKEKMYQLVNEAMNRGSVLIYMTMDFAPLLDIETDFIALFSWQGLAWDLELLLHNGEEIGHYWTGGQAWDALFDNFLKSCNREMSN